MDIVGRTLQVVIEQYTRLKREAENVVLRVNASQTKAGGTEHDRASTGRNLTFAGDKLKVVDEFAYLRSLANSREIRR